MQYQRGCLPLAQGVDGQLAELQHLILTGLLGVSVGVGLNDQHPLFHLDVDTDVERAGVEKRPDFPD